MPLFQNLQELSCGSNTRHSSLAEALGCGLALDGTTSGEQGGERGIFLCLTHPHPQIPSKDELGPWTRWRGRALGSASEFDEALTSQSLQELSLSPAFRHQALVSWKATVPQTRGGATG